MADTFGTYGTWKLDGFEDQLTAWRDREAPSDCLVTQVQAWWPGMEHASARVNARPADDEATADCGGEENAFVMAVPGCYQMDEARGMLRVLCFFRVFEADHRVLCCAFHTTVRRT